MFGFNKICHICYLLHISSIIFGLQYWESVSPPLPWGRVSGCWRSLESSLQSFHRPRPLAGGSSRLCFLIDESLKQDSAWRQIPLERAKGHPFETRNLSLGLPTWSIIIAIVVFLSENMELICLDEKSEALKIYVRYSLWETEGRNQLYSSSTLFHLFVCSICFRVSRLVGDFKTSFLQNRISINILGNALFDCFLCQESRWWKYEAIVVSFLPLWHLYYWCFLDELAGDDKYYRGQLNAFIGEPLRNRVPTHLEFLSFPQNSEFFMI